MATVDVKETIKATPLVVFGASWCGFCKKAIAALQEAGFNPEVHVAPAASNLTYHHIFKRRSVALFMIADPSSS